MTCVFVGECLALCRTYITRATDFKILAITLWSDYATLKACKRPQTPPGTTYTLSEAVEKRFSGNTPFARCLRLKYREPNNSTSSFACNRSSIEKTKNKRKSGISTYDRQDFENELPINYQKRDQLTQNCKQ